MEGAEWDILQEVRKGVREGQSEDVVMSAMKELDRAGEDSMKFGVVTGEWSMEVS
jgi:hypothetical protein